MSFDQHRPADTNGGPSPIVSSGVHDPEIQRRLESALHSPYGIEKLLNRLKQSIFSAREFSGFLKERCALEDKYAQGYKRLVRHAAESVRRPESRQGSWARSFDESLKINERLADNGVQYVGSLQTMAEELRDMAENAEKGRKHWKHTTVDAEKRLAEAEDQQLKAKNRYNTAAEQYDRVRTGEKTGGKFGLKNKSGAQQEEALKEKTDMLDQEYTAKTQAAQESRREFETGTKPHIVRNLQDLISETDAALAMQMAKLASLSEKHMVSNAMAIAPIKGADGTEPTSRGLRQVAQGIDDRKDFQDYMLDGVEPPPQFKGRSRRNTDAELVHTPVQSTPNVDSRPSYDAPYNGPQAHSESQPPQLPQIGGEDSFSKSFDMQRPPPQDRDSSFMTSQPDSLQRTPTSQTQQTGVIQEPTAPYGAGRAAPGVPSLPSFDRAQASPTDAYGGPPRHDTMGPSGLGSHPPRHDIIGPSSIGSHPPRQDTVGPSSIGSHPAQRQGTMGPSGFGGQGPPMHDTTAPPSYGMQGPPRQEHSSQPSFGSTGPPRQDSMGPAPGLGRGQPPNQAGPYMGRGGPAPGSYMDPGKSAGPYGAAPMGRSQQPSATRNLPSQQPPRPTLPPTNPVFGMHLDELFRRDGTAVPAVVFQCIQAIDTFGLHTEGIYRISGATPTVLQLKSEFDHDSSLVKLNSPSTFNNDIASVATLLKNFLRDLTDPLLTNTAYHSFIQAAQYEDPIMRRDALHQYINSLPDPNYATLRVLVLHLHRVAMNSEINKMDMKNLAIVFGPTIMGGREASDAGWQTKVVETILLHTHDVFDPDEEGNE